MHNVIEDEAQICFAKNLKKLLKQNNITQKQLAQKMGVLESTVSNCNKKLPTCDFLLKLKSVFPDISIDDMLMREIPDVSNNKLSDGMNGELQKYLGVYYIYYLDTSKKRPFRGNDFSETEAILKTGILYVYKSPAGFISSKTSCLALFGIKKREVARDIKRRIESYSSPKDVIDYLREHYPHNLYQGTFNLSQTHMFIILEQDRDNKDTALIIFHHIEINNAEYIGGLGTINSASAGRPSDPVVQLIGMSRENILLSDEQIQFHLRFQSPYIELGDDSDEILELAKKLYEKSEMVSDPISSNDVLLEKYIPTILCSKLERMLNKNIENNLLWYGKVSSVADDYWYHQLKISREKYSKGEENE